MITITDTVLINAPLDRVFDAERNISPHARTQEHHGEKPVGGVTEGLIELGQEVEWEATHFGIRQRLRVRITHMDKPQYFRDEMVFGAFKSFSHEHHFRPASAGVTEKSDIMHIQAPLGPLGLLAERLFLRSYMTRFIKAKNLQLKTLVEEHP